MASITTFMTEEQRNAVWDVIKILKAKPCEDVISREHLLSGIDELMQSPWFNNGKDEKSIAHYGYVERKEAVEVVRDLCVKAEPSVTPKQRTGKWIKHNTDHSVYYDCSLCGCAAPCTETADKILWKMANYCYDCGAKMEGEQLPS